MTFVLQFIVLCNRYMLANFQSNVSLVSIKLHMFKFTYLYLHISTCSYICTLYICVVCWCFFVCPFCISLAVCVGSQYVKSECMYTRLSTFLFLLFHLEKTEGLPSLPPPITSGSELAAWSPALKMGEKGKSKVDQGGVDCTLLRS